MAQKPLLVFPKPTLVKKSRLFGGGDPPHLPSRSQQIKRIGPKFTTLMQALKAEKAELTAQPTGMDPEQVLVLEIAGSIEKFLQAVQRIPDLEWLADVETDEIEPDDFFYEIDTNGKKRKRKTSKANFFLQWLINKQWMNFCQYGICFGRTNPLVTAEQYGKIFSNIYTNCAVGRSKIDWQKQD